MHMYNTSFTPTRPTPDWQQTKQTMTLPLYGQRSIGLVSVLSMFGSVTEGWLRYCHYCQNNPCLCYLQCFLNVFLPPQDQLRRFLEVRNTDMPPVIAAKKTREFRSTPQEQVTAWDVHACVYSFNPLPTATIWSMY